MGQAATELRTEQNWSRMQLSWMFSNVKVPKSQLAIRNVGALCQGVHLAAKKRGQAPYSEQNSTLKWARSNLKPFHLVEYSWNEFCFSFCPLNVLEMVIFLCCLFLGLAEMGEAFLFLVGSISYQMFTFVSSCPCFFSVFRLVCRACLFGVLYFWILSEVGYGLWGCFFH